MRKIYLTNNGLQEILEGQDFLIKDDWVKCELKEDGTPYKNYNTDGTPDLDLENKENRIAEIKTSISEKETYLSITDWITAKYNDEVTILATISKADFVAKYQEVYTNRANVRDEINTLQQELKTLEQ